MSFVAGRVMVPVVPDFRAGGGFQKTVRRNAIGAGTAFGQEFQQASKGGFARAGSIGVGVLKKTVKAGLAGGALFAGITVKKGLDRLMGIEDARASLKGLGHDMKSIDKIMKNALASVKGTAFGMADAGKVAASAVAAGVKPGKDLTRTLKLVGDGATIAKVSFGEMGSIFGKVAASNKIQGDVIAQLNDQGIPIIQLLSKELGKSAEDTVALASAGKINFATFQNAMEAGLGGAAKKSGDTMRGSFANMQAALGRVGANLLSGVFPKIRGGFQDLTKWLGPLEDKATVVGQKLGTFASDAVTKLGEVKRSLGGFTLDTDKFDGEAFGTKLAAGIGTGLGKLGGLAKTFTKRIGELAGKIDWVELGLELGKAAVPLVAGLVLGILNVDVGKLLGSLGQHWKEVVVGLLMVAFAPSKLLAPIARIIGKIPFVGPMVVWMAKGFRGVTRSVLGYIGGLFLQIWKGFKVQMGWLGPSWIGQLTTMLRGFFPALKNWATEFLKGIDFSVRLWAARFGGAIARWGTTALRQMREFVASLLRPFSGAGAWLLDAGKNLLLGLLRGIRNPISTIRNTVGSLRGAFSSVVTGIAAVWAGLREKMATPVNWIIRNVINKLIAGMNKIPGVNIGTVGEIGSDKKTPKTSQPGHGPTAQGGKGGRGGRSWGGKTDGKSGGKRTWPANTKAMSNNYSGHSGIDIAAAGGSPIRAASGGTVEYTGWGRGYGQAIFVRGDDGLLQIYGHSSKVSTRAGQRVSAGDVLGLVGSTGNSTGNHLHFEIAKSAPGSASNRAATLAWLGGAKMGKSGPSTIDVLRNSVSGVSAKGAPKGSWFDVGSLTGYLKNAALSGGKHLLSAPLKGAKKVAGLVGIGGIGGKKKPSKAARRSVARKARRAELRQLKREAAKRDKAAAVARAERAAARPGLLSSSTLATIGSGASITNGFITGQLTAPVATQEQLRQQYAGAQANVLATADRVEASFSAAEAAAREAAPQTARVAAIDKKLKDRRTGAQLSKAERSGQTRLANARAAAGAKNAAAARKRQERVAAAEKRVAEAKTPAGKKTARAALAKARKSGSGSSAAVTSAERNLAAIRKERAEVKKLAAEKKKIQGSKQIKDLAAAEAARAKALEDQTAAEEAATAAAEAYRAAQDAAIERATNVQNIGIGLGSISSAGFKTSGGILSNLRKAVSTVNTWKDIVPKLISAGLRGPILEEFINAGPSAEAVFTGKSLLAGGGIGTINDLQNQLKAASIEAGALAGPEYTSPGATGSGLAGSWSSSSAPYRSAVASPGASGYGGPLVAVNYSGMPADTVDSIADKTATRVVREFSRAQP